MDHLTEFVLPEPSTTLRLSDLCAIMSICVFIFILVIR